MRYQPRQPSKCFLVCAPTLPASLPVPVPLASPHEDLEWWFLLSLARSCPELCGAEIASFAYVKSSLVSLEGYSANCSTIDNPIKSTSCWNVFLFSISLNRSILLKSEKKFLHLFHNRPYLDAGRWMLASVRLGDKLGIFTEQEPLLHWADQPERSIGRDSRENASTTR